MLLQFYHKPIQYFTVSSIKSHLINKRKLNAIATKLFTVFIVEKIIIVDVRIYSQIYCKYFQLVS